jgi:hypothetical protein
MEFHFVHQSEGNIPSLSLLEHFFLQPAYLAMGATDSRIKQRKR